MKLACTIKYPTDPSQRPACLSYYCYAWQAMVLSCHTPCSRGMENTLTMRRQTRQSRLLLVWSLSFQMSFFFQIQTIAFCGSLICHDMAVALSDKMEDSVLWLVRSACESNFQRRVNWQILYLIHFNRQRERERERERESWNFSWSLMVCKCSSWAKKCQRRLSTVLSRYQSLKLKVRDHSSSNSSMTKLS